ncbi:hypothetical protein HN51_007526, partial [Arachis hypogaea]
MVVDTGEEAMVVVFATTAVGKVTWPRRRRLFIFSSAVNCFSYDLIETNILSSWAEKPKKVGTQHLGLGFDHLITSKEALGAVRRTVVAGVVAAAPVGGAQDLPVVEVVRGGEGAGPLCEAPILSWINQDVNGVMFFVLEGQDSDGDSSDDCFGHYHGTDEEYDENEVFEARGGSKAREKGVGDGVNCRG